SVSLRKLGEEINELQRKEQEWRYGQEGFKIREVRLPGDVAFRMYDTFGLQRDVIEEQVRLGGLSGVEWDVFDKAMGEQRERGRVSWKGGHKDVANPAYAKLAETYRTQPDFYFATTAKDC